MKNQKTVRQPGQKRSKETKEKIVQAANELFSEKGFYRTNTKQIAARASVPVGSFYAYFRDKKDVLKESINVAFEKIHESFVSFKESVDFQAGDLKSTMEEIFRISLRIHEMIPEYHREIKVLRFNEPDLREFLREKEELSFVETRSMLEAVSSHIEDIEAAAVVIDKTVEHMVHYILYDSPRLSRERLISAAADMLYRYLTGGM